MANYQRQNRTEGEGKGIRAEFQCAGCRQRGNRSGVSAGHPAVPKQPGHLQFSGLYGIDKRFAHLRQQPRGQADAQETVFS